MKFSVGHGRDGAVERLEKRGVTRRDFMKFCGTVAAVMGMGPAFARKSPKPSRQTTGPTWSGCTTLNVLAVPNPF